MHEMDNTKKIITIIGLVFEVISVLAIVFGIWILSNFENIPGMDIDLAEMSQAEYDLMMWYFNLMVSILKVMAYVVGAITLINVYLFSRLIGGKYTEQQAKRVYLYQAIWGGINLLSNQITGVLYLISGVGGYNGHKEQKDIRTGI
ncbi:hypothetical protein KQ51_00496 [Candidatus Izimaplasma bacterium HR1]|jgi:Na+/H+-dicarboxylate symporter|uniref:hypothetical protein n=1 Tax=Candidatus Izimoplasma sp. HR1 TaxID=1541959 RepID=UPI0004F8A6E4|nr:hypothetical protein KQ51_00496 [Candidatus Izimaplasma bacterium HR1]